MRNQWLPWMVCAAIAGVGAPALASGSETRSANAFVETRDNYFKDLADGDTRVVRRAPGVKVVRTNPLQAHIDLLAHGDAGERLAIRVRVFAQHFQPLPDRVQRFGLIFNHQNLHCQNKRLLDN